MVSGCAAAWMPWDKLEHRISNAGLGDEGSGKARSLVILVISQGVPNATNGANQLYFSLDVYFVSQVLHVYVDNIGGGIEGDIPYFSHEGYA
jgi:hypothetical protein